MSPSYPQKLFLAVAGVALLGIVALAACVPVEGPPAPERAAPAAPPGPKIVTVALGTEPESRDPYGHSTSTAYGIWLQALEPLLDYDFEKRAFFPVLATSWENPDPKTWVFRLRKGVKFHDGSDFTAKDVVHSFTRIKTDKISRQASALREIERVEPLDDFTVALHTKEPMAPLPDRLTNRVITGKAAYEQHGTESDKYIVGTGPFRFKEFIQGQRFVVEKNPTYWGKAAQVDEAVFRAIPEAEARITALLNQEVDIINIVPPEALPRLTGHVRVEGVPSLRLMFLAINPIVEPLKNPLVRKAINHAIDRDALIKGVLRGEAFRLDSPISPQVYAYDANLKPTYAYDPAKAKQLLAQAGYPDGFAIELWTPIGRYTKDKELTEVMAAQLKQVGIQPTIKTAEWGTYFSDYIAGGKLPLYLLGRGNVVDPSEYLSQYFEAGVTKRLGGFSDPKVNELLQRERGAFNPEARVRLLREAMSAIMEAAPMAFLFTYKDNYGVNNRIAWKPRPDEYVMATDMQVK